jgi:hypothetical protein
MHGHELPSIRRGSAYRNAAGAVGAACFFFGLLVVGSSAASADVEVSVAERTMYVVDTPGTSGPVFLRADPAQHFAFPVFPNAPGTTIITPPPVDLPERFMVSTEGAPPTGQGPCAPMPVASGRPDSAYCPTDGIQRIVFDLGDGADELIVSPDITTPNDGLPIRTPVDVSLGDGDDVVQFAYGLYGDVSIDGGAGNDRIELDCPLDPGLVTGPTRADIRGGAGDDRLCASSKVGDLRIDGAAGDDWITGAATTPHATTMLGGPGNDNIGERLGPNRVDAGAGDDKILLPEFPDGNLDRYTCGPGSDHLVASGGGPPREDVYADDCPPRGAVRIARTGRIRMSGASATASIGVTIRNPLSLSATLGAPVTLGRIRRVRLRPGRRTLRFALGRSGRAAVRGRRSVRLNIAGVADNRQGDRAGLSLGGRGELGGGINRRFRVSG